MKKVIFVCLLTFSVCLSQSTNTGNPASPPQHEAAPAAPAAAPTAAPAAAPAAVPAAAPAAAPAAGAPAQPTPPTVATPPSTVDPKPTEHNNKSNEADTKPTAAPASVPAAPQQSNQTNTTTDVKPGPHTDTTTSSTTTTTTTTAAPSSENVPSKPTATTEKPTLQARGFDGASFVGGIILTLGLLAIGFMGFKYYKAQTERNYHTL